MADKKTVAYIVRHGTTDLNAQDKYRGQIDTPLDSKGKKDAEDLRKWFKDKKIGKAWTSDLARAKDTANTILQGKKTPATRSGDLRPLDAGDLAGKPKDAKHKAIMQKYQDDTSKTIPGGESIDNLHSRTRRPLFQAFRAGLKGDPSLVSTHSSVIHSVGHHLHDNHEAALVEPGGVVEVTWDGKKFHAKPVFKPKTKKAEAEKNPEYAS